MGKAQQSETSPNTYRARLGRRLVAAAAGGSAVMVAVLMLLAPAASAAIGVGTTVAPYKGIGVTPYNSWSQGGCGHAKVIKLAKFSLFTGSGGWADTATAKTCSKVVAGFGSSSSGYASGEINLGIPFKVSSGTHSFDLNWTVTVAASTSVHVMGHCPTLKYSGTGYASQYCFVEGFVYMYAYGYMYDVTNNTYLGSTSFLQPVANFTEVYNDTYCYSGNCYYYNYSSPSLSGSFSGSVSFDQMVSPTISLKSTHKYVLNVYMYGAADAYVYSNPNPGYIGSTAAASLNVGTLGNGVVLNHITVT